MPSIDQTTLSINGGGVEDRKRPVDLRFIIKSQYILFLFVCTVFLAGTTLGGQSFENSRKVFYYELFFISGYILLLRPDPRPLQWVRTNKTLAVLGLLLIVTIALFHFYLSLKALLYIGLVSYAGIFHRAYLTGLLIKNWLPISILALWLIEITISYHLSPYQVDSHLLGRERYEQTLVHTALFLVVWDYFRANNKAILPVLVTFALSALAVALGSLVLYLMADPQTLNPRAWFQHPPFNSHMRHVGYQITAGLAVMLPLLAYRKVRLIWEWLSSALAISLWAFLFWSGGRSAIASIIITIALLAIYLYHQQLQYKRFVLFALATAVIGLIISELLHVFPWNGLNQAIWRVAGAEDMQKLTSGRTQIWHVSWLAVKDHLLLGLGPQGYFFIPDRFKGTMQPHSMFVQFVVEWGLAGTLVFLAMIAWAFIIGLKRSTQRYTQEALLASLSAGSVITALTLHGLFDGTYYHPQPSLYLAIGFAAWLRPAPQEK